MARLTALVLLMLGAWLAGSNPAEAQPRGPSPRPDFLFGAPNGMIGIRGGWLVANAQGDLLTDIRQQLTIEREDFNAPSFGIDVEIAANPRLSVIGGFDFSKATIDSEYRDFVDDRRLPITQTTSLREINLSASLKMALTPRGREISSRAWIPAAVTPYVGAGGGIMHYQFLQFGDFVDFDTANLEIFADTFRSEGWTPSAHVFGGVDVRVWRRMYLSGEARYLWAGATPNQRFIGLERLDLAGMKGTIGVHYMF